MHSVEFFSNGERGRILFFKVFIPLVSVFFPVPISTHITMPLDLFSLQTNALQCLKYACTTVLVVVVFEKLVTASEILFSVITGFMVIELLGY